MSEIVRARRSATTRSRSASTERALLHDVRELIVEARTRVARATNVTLTLTYWRIGDRIRRVVLGEKRADYGRNVIERLATQLTHLELLRLDEHGIHVAEYLTEFPPRQILQQTARRNRARAQQNERSGRIARMIGLGAHLQRRGGLPVAQPRATRSPQPPTSPPCSREVR